MIRSTPHYYSDTMLTVMNMTYYEMMAVMMQNDQLGLYGIVVGDNCKLKMGVIFDTVWIENLQFGWYSDVQSRPNNHFDQIWNRDWML